MARFEDIKWPDEYKGLTRIDDLLHCRICYEYITTPVITRCSHNFCSICIRKFLNYKTKCPMCFEQIYEKDLHANRILDEFKECYLSVRDKISSCIKSVELKGTNESHGNVTPVNSIKLEKTELTARGIKTSRQLYRNNSEPSPRKFTPKKSSVNNETSKTPSKNIIPSPSTSENTPTMISWFLPTKQRSDESANRIGCPVCSLKISEANINRHLDDCLKRDESMPPRKASYSSHPPMPKYVLNLMKESAIRKVLKEYGLSTSGVRKALEKRLQKFSTLYNAERDTLEPKSIAEIVEQCESEETTERSIARQNAPRHALDSRHRNNVGMIEEMHKQYLEENKDNFQKLIDSINDREKKEDKPGGSLSSRGYKEDGSSTSSTSKISSQSIFLKENNKTETNFPSLDLCNYMADDSSSTNASYPLQHYFNEDSIGHLSSYVASEIVKNTASSPSRNEIPIKCEIKSEPASEPENLLDRIIPSNLSSSSQMFSFSSENENVQTNAVVKNVFEATTEVDSSDSGKNESSVNMNKRSKRFVMKRTKAEVSNQSTDSETDVETSSPRSVGRKISKLQKPGCPDKEETEAPNKHGNLYRESRVKELPADLAAVICSGISSSSRDKENTQLSRMMDDEKTNARRSSRKRNHISYALNARGVGISDKSDKKNKMASDEPEVNLSVKETSTENKEPLKEKRIEIESGRDCESTNRSVREPKRSLRKRRKPETSKT